MKEALLMTMMKRIIMIEIMMMLIGKVEWKCSGCCRDAVVLALQNVAVAVVA